MNHTDGSFVIQEKYPQTGATVGQIFVCVTGSVTIRDTELTMQCSLQMLLFLKYILHIMWRKNYLGLFIKASFC